ncbi:uncharacterized protein LOC125685950 isoform X1 [Lagopus muta]|uniref:uncharacterized protein LOC125685950 isoform X1 n=1 Tax=Lagopus muta TaxID=64668 RepID=UPI00209C7DFC|nr:uncharacterized protein LOC125685950 isoform X1 [Lagopus muta]
MPPSPGTPCSGAAARAAGTLHPPPTAAMGSGRAVAAGAVLVALVALGARLAAGTRPSAFFQWSATVECHFLNGTERMRFLVRHVYNRQQYVHFDSDVGLFVADAVLGEPSARLFNSQPDVLEKNRAAVEMLCNYNHEIVAPLTLQKRGELTRPHSSRRHSADEHAALPQPVPNALPLSPGRAQGEDLCAAVGLPAPNRPAGLLRDGLLPPRDRSEVVPERAGGDGAHRVHGRDPERRLDLPGAGAAGDQPTARGQLRVPGGAHQPAAAHQPALGAAGGCGQEQAAAGRRGLCGGARLPGAGALPLPAQ